MVMAECVWRNHHQESQDTERGAGCESDFSNQSPHRNHFLQTHPKDPGQLPVGEDMAL